MSDTAMNAHSKSDGWSETTGGSNRRHTEIALQIIAIIIAAVVLARSPMVRSHCEANETETHAVTGGANVDKQFKRPPDEGGLL